MTFRNLDSSGDWAFGKGKSDYVSGNAEVALNIKTRVLSWVGDCFFAVTSGVDWLNRLGNKNQQKLLAADLRRIILQTDGVTALKKIDIVYSGRTMSATYTINTIYSKEYTDSLTMGTGV